MTRIATLRGPALERTALLAVLLGCLVEAFTSFGWPSGLTWAAVATGMVVPLAMRRRAPLAAVLTACTAGVIGSFVVADMQDFSTPFLVLLLCAMVAGGIARTRDAVAGYAACCVLVAAVAVHAERVIVGDFLFPMGFALGTWAAARAIHQRTLLAAELHEATLRAEEERATDAAHAVADERRRIAREMHDLIGHSVSVMVVQAGGARRILDHDPARAIEAAARVEETGRAALVEMRRLLGMLGPDDPAQLAPQPSLDDLDTLVERARTAGVALATSIEGAPRPLPAGAELAAYRVVQEALTNVVKHGRSGDARLIVRWADDALELWVSDDGRDEDHAMAGPSLGGSGHGLVGMQERVRAYGGEVVAGPRAGGGFEVRARIPYEQSAVAVG
ncbi:MAG: sensor histidine kinase [Solirubrobacterales bacterium]|nr:sensor histidine kinase [Solirubrobacterales bacterium]